jgi:selT/selW/selH-like putative selenoprotein
MFFSRDYAAAEAALSAVTANTKVAVEFCGAWGYDSKFEELKDALRAANPAIAADGGTGRGSSFEVTVIKGGVKTCVYSKLSTGRFPHFKELAARIASS